MDHSYRNTFETPLTTQEHWEFIFNEICSFPTRDVRILGIGWPMNIWNGQTLLSILKRWIGLKSFWIKRIRRSPCFQLVILTQLRINRLADKYPGRINFELSVITLRANRKQLMPKGPSVDQVLADFGWSGRDICEFLFIWVQIPCLKMQRRISED